MVGSSKILTVSYGTFSCTLEGFDDPFSTMKAIAEYFRNLAAEDRYFGAEPPTPDANMLHQIAENAIKKRVEAKVEENAVTLRQADAVAEDSPLEPAEAAEMMEILNAGVDEPAQTAAEMLADDDLETDNAPIEDDEDDHAVESAAEKLARLRALVANAESGEYTEDEHAEDVTLAPAEEADDADRAMTDIEEIEASDRSDVAEEAPEVEISAPLKELIEEQAATESVRDAEIEENTADEAPVQAKAEAPEAVSSIDAELAAEDDDDGFDLDSLTAALADTPAEANDPSDVLDSAEAPAEVDLGAIKDAVSEDAAEQSPVEMADEAPAPVDETPIDEEPVPAIAEQTLPEAEEPVIAEEVSETPRARVRKVRVIKAKKTGIAEAAAPEALPEVKRVASVEPTDEAAVARLMEQTDDQMEGGETRRRQDAFVHLKAAVAAARAEGDDDQDEEAKAEAEFRRDLEDVIRPNPSRPTGRLAPLVLVSEQRIDAPADLAGRTAASAGNLALQDEEEALAEATDFTEFAERVGAVEMNDLLEAAAAYASHVEGRAEFTRPVIMRHVEAARGSEEFSREEGLRSFGTLLRNGTIRKLKRGKFEIAEDSKFAQEARAVGE